MPAMTTGRREVDGIGEARIPDGGIGGIGAPGIK
jgi:hypothetical protein